MDRLKRSCCNLKRKRLVREKMRSLWVPIGFCLPRLNPLCFITYISAKTNNQIKIKSLQHIFLSFSLPITVAPFSLDKLKRTAFAQIKLMTPLSRCTRRLLALKKCEALMSMTWSNDKHAGFLCFLINFLSWSGFLELHDAYAKSWSPNTNRNSMK